MLKTRFMLIEQRCNSTWVSWNKAVRPKKYITSLYIHIIINQRLKVSFPLTLQLTSYRIDNRCLLHHLYLKLHKSSTARTPHHILIGVHPVTWFFDRPFGAALDIYEGGNIYMVRDFTSLGAAQRTWPPCPMRLFKSKNNMRSF